jgi:hypothetical protein
MREGERDDKGSENWRKRKEMSERDIKGSEERGSVRESMSGQLRREREDGEGRRERERKRKM